MTTTPVSERPAALLDELLDIAREVAAAAGAAALEWRTRADTLTVEEKTGPGDLVTQADRDAEQAARAVLARRRPDDAVHGEEYGAAAGRSGGTGGITWLLDPIDGTTNYVYGRDDWAVSVAAVDDADGRVLAAVVTEPAVGHVTEARLGGGTHFDGRPVRVRPPAALDATMVEVGLGRTARRARSDRLMAVLVPRLRDVRRGGSAAIALTSVATGRVDASWGPDLAPWDMAAGVLLVTEAGGVVADLGGPMAGGLPLSGDVLATSPALAEPLRELLREVYC